MEGSRRSCGQAGAQEHSRANEPAASRQKARDPKVSGHEGRGRRPRADQRRATKGNAPGDEARPEPVYAALDLGTNNCRLLVARPTRRGFQVIDAFSRIIRLGEGVSISGYLTDAAIERTLEALKVCASKMVRNNVTRSHLVATEACRSACNGLEFIERVRQDVGMELEILSREAEAQLAVSGCVSLIDDGCDHALVFDIGGGSSELIWLDIAKRKRDGTEAANVAPTACIEAWTSLPVGVVSLAEKFGGKHVRPQDFEDMVQWVSALIKPFEEKHNFRERIAQGKVHFLGTSGTVTTVAGIQLRLPRYDRRQVDGCWLDCSDVRSVTYSLLEQTYEQRVAQPCIGRDRADLVLAGCAILEALMRAWPTKRLRVADRGLREGMLTNMMAADGFRITSQVQGRPGR